MCISLVYVTKNRKIEKVIKGMQLARYIGRYIHNYLSNTFYKYKYLACNKISNIYYFLLGTAFVGLVVTTRGLGAWGYF